MTDDLVSESHGASDALASGFTALRAGDVATAQAAAEQILETLQPLLALPVELVLPTHGPPGDRAALERALG